VAPLEPWERVWIDAEKYSQDVHSLINCTDCHGGQAVDDMSAHEGMVDEPAANPEACGDCHTDVTPAHLNSLHFTLAGYDTAVYERSTPENHPAIENMESFHCQNCHATCGDCHISQPASVGGGLLDGHAYVPVPPMSQTCTACHGSRVKNEYYGLNEGFPADVHFRGRMSCVDCHTGDEMHGVNMTANHRYDGPAEPSCESCHADQIGVGSGIEQHEIHGTEIVSCQTCHSVQYTNCINCHVEQTEDNIPFYTVEDHFMGFYIGKNPEQNADRPYRYTTLRHIPVDINSFSYYGENLLDQFDNRPTWEYATPHNIQKNTPQNASCESCHENDSIFLTADKVAPEELAANQSVIVEHAPMLPDWYVPAVVEEGEDSGDSGGGDDFWGGGSDSEGDSGGGDDFWGGESDSGSSDSGGESDFWGGDSSGGDTGSGNNSEGGGDADFWGGN